MGGEGEVAPYHAKVLPVQALADEVCAAVTAAEQHEANPWSERGEPLAQQSPRHPQGLNVVVSVELRGGNRNPVRKP